MASHLPTRIAAPAARVQLPAAPLLSARAIASPTARLCSRACELSVSTHPALELGAFVTELPAPLAELATPDWLLRAAGAGRAGAAGLRRRRARGRARRAARARLQADRTRQAGLGVSAARRRRGHAVVDQPRRRRRQRRVAALGAAHQRRRPGAGPRAAARGRGRRGRRLCLQRRRPDHRRRRLPCLFDAAGACANAVKDAQRTKTSAATRRTLSLVWGARALGDRTARTVDWYRQLLARAGAVTHSVAIEETP